ncbi:hypothetical protein MKX01_036782, partial [Papaver californicum]
METRRGGSSSEEDKISKLSDELIHHILSFNDMKYAVRTCVLSKRWRYIWTSLPTLNFDYPSQSLYSGQDDLVKVVNNVLEHRNNELYNIQRFHLCKGQYRWCISSVPLGRWIGAAIKANAEDIDIGRFGGRILIEGLFTCKSLKKLTLMETLMMIPESIYLPRLVYLKLYKSQCMDEKDLNNLISSYPVLEDLYLTLHDSISWMFAGYKNLYSGMNVNIHSTTLKHLEFRNESNDSGRFTLSLNLHAPNLVSLIFTSATNGRIALENVSSVVAATIDPKANPQCALKFLGAIRNVKYLTLSAAPLEVLLYF